VIDGLAYAVIVVSLVVGVGIIGLAVADRRPLTLLAYGLVTVEAAALIQVLVAIVQVVRGERPDEPATFVGYALGAHRTNAAGLGLVPTVLIAGSRPFRCPRNEMLRLRNVHSCTEFTGLVTKRVRVVGKMVARGGAMTFMVDPAGKPDGQETGRAHRHTSLCNGG
jgi:hypothetical protein